MPRPACSPPAFCDLGFSAKRRFELVRTKLHEINVLQHRGELDWSAPDEFFANPSEPGESEPVRDQPKPSRTELGRAFACSVATAEEDLGRRPVRSCDVLRRPASMLTTVATYAPARGRFVRRHPSRLFEKPTSAFRSREDGN
jgi:hypothetical protein